MIWYNVEKTPQHFDKLAQMASKTQKSLYKAGQFLTEKALPRLK